MNQVDKQPLLGRCSILRSKNQIALRKTKHRFVNLCFLSCLRGHPSTLGADHEGRSAVIYRELLGLTYGDIWPTVRLGLGLK